MFWNKKIVSDPLGIPLQDLMMCLKPTTIKASIENNVLIARHEKYITRIEVIPPESNAVQTDPIKAVVRIKTDISSMIKQAADLAKPESVAMFNSFAALGAMTISQGVASIGSRLTIFEVEDAWKTLHLPLLLFTTILGAEAQLGGFRRVLTGEPPKQERSAWSDADFAQVQKYLSRGCVCTTGGLGLTAEFALKPGEHSAASGASSTALFQIMADQPHPELGGGLFALLQMPHRIAEEDDLVRISATLNTLEMEAKDLPPHFGAWCPSTNGRTLAYVSFFGNPFHEVAGIATNIAIWAKCRADWANTQLAALGIRL